MAESSKRTSKKIGINCATYVGYPSVLHAGYSHWVACIGSLIASLSIMWLPFIIMILISKYLMSHKDSKDVQNIFSGLRPAIIGLIAAAAVYNQCTPLCLRLLFHESKEDESDFSHAALWSHRNIHIIESMGLNRLYPPNYITPKQAYAPRNEDVRLLFYSPLPFSK